MMHLGPLISVVIPSRNRPQHILTAISSILAQTYQKIEVIVVDDGSPEPLAPLLANVFGDRVRCIRNEIPQGAPSARNMGWKQANGEFVAFLDDDDQWLPNKLAHQFYYFKEAGSNCVLVGCSFAYVKAGVQVATRKSPKTKGLFENLLKSNVIGGCSVPLISRTALERVGGFDEAFESCQDWELWLRLLRLGTASFVPEILVLRRVHHGQITSNLSRKIVGRERLLGKFVEEFEKRPESWAIHLRRLGTLRLLNNNRVEANNFFWKALSVNLKDWRNWAGAGLTLLPISISKILARQAGTMKLGEIVFYH